MSYDLKLFSVPEGIEPGAAYEELLSREESEIVDTGEPVNGPSPEATRAAMQQLADAVRLCWPSFVQFQPVSPLPCIELNEGNLEIQFAICEHTASMTMPYFREWTDERMQCIGCCLLTCREERGYVAYDPQVGRVVTVGNLDEMARLYDGVNKAIPGLRSNASRSKPWWKFW